VARRAVGRGMKSVVENGWLWDSRCNVIKRQMVLFELPMNYQVEIVEGRAGGKAGRREGTKRRRQHK